MQNSDVFPEAPMEGFTAIRETHCDQFPDEACDLLAIALLPAFGPSQIHRKGHIEDFEGRVLRPPVDAGSEDTYLPLPGNSSFSAAAAAPVLDCTSLAVAMASSTLPPANAPCARAHPSVASARLD